MFVFSCLATFHFASVRVGHSIANDHYRGVLEYYLTARYSTLSENEASA